MDDLSVLPGEHGVMRKNKMRLSIRDLKSIPISDRTWSELGELQDREAKRLIGLLARHGGPGEELWCMYALSHIRPPLHEFIRYWTAGGYEDVRKFQETGEGSERVSSLVSEFMRSIHILPRTRKPFSHYSKDASWPERMSVGEVFSPNSFMSCAIEGSDFVYADTLRLQFSPSSQPYYLGSLTAECCEREVLIPPGSSFEVFKVESGVVYLKDHGITQPHN